MSNSAPDEFSIENPLCNSSLGSMVTLDYVTPLTGYEPKEMELTDADELNLATTSDVYFQNTLDDTASFPNDPDVDDNELAEFLVVVVDRTGKPVEVRSNNDQFSCDIRNLKSAQSQFPLVTQPKKMISQTGGSVQERIAEERESSNAQIRTMLDEQRRTIIAECSEKVLHHELLAAQAEQDRKNLQEELLRQQQDFREVKFSRCKVGIDKLIAQSSLSSRVLVFPGAWIRQKMVEKVLLNSHYPVIQCSVVPVPWREENLEAKEV